ncbi:hypothetical protein CRUP_019025 [Coryphaenoides rupestris]|nr:hypothetical protein CRUP_019025 [Coryphaenoides rupestris]
MALWALMAAPLLMSNDLRSLCPRSKALLQNRRVIDINQDPLGRQGYRTAILGSFEVWERSLSNNFTAVAVRNKQELGGPQKLPVVKVPGWRACEFQCNVTQILPQYKELGLQKHQTNLAVAVNPSGVALFTIRPILD